MTSSNIINNKNTNKWMEFEEPHTGLVKNDFFGYWYLQYCLITGLYMLEPWERKLFNSFVICLVGGIFSVCYFIFRTINI